MTNRKKIILLISTITLILFVLLVCLYLSNIGKTSVNISVAPIDSKLLLDQKTSIKSGENIITLGTHTIQVSRDGFSRKTVRFVVENGNTNIVPIALIPNTSAGNTYLVNHSSDFIKIGDLQIPQTDAVNQELKNQYPLITKLPMEKSRHYIITYEYPNDTTGLVIYISTASPADKRSALSAIYEAGYDPSDYEIVFEAYKL